MTGQPSDCVQKPLQRATDEHSERVESDADLCPHDGQQEEQGEDDQDAVSLRPPSKGGNGSMLKIASMRLKTTDCSKASATHFAAFSGNSGIRWSSAAEMIARAMLIPGPAAATSTMSRRGWCRRWKFTGTGFAQPKRKGARAISKMAGRMMVPNESICRNGLNVTRLSRRAVSSPSLSAHNR